MSNYTTGTGQKLVDVHSKDNCKGKFCTIHNPSMTWPTNWRPDWGFMEYLCPCGVGYPAPDDMNENGHLFGTCGKKECFEEWKKACEKVKENNKLG